MTAARIVQSTRPRPQPGPHPLDCIDRSDGFLPPSRRYFVGGIRLFRSGFVEGDIEVAMGTVKWFNPIKGYGFIKPDNGGQDVFVHVSAVERAGYSGLAEGAKISYELVTTRLGKTAAENLRLG